MNRRMKRRRSYSHRNRPSLRVNFTAVIVIICLSIGAGYLTARYVVYPLIGASPVNLNLFDEDKDTNKNKEKSDGAISDKQEEVASDIDSDTSSDKTVDTNEKRKKTTSDDKATTVSSGYYLQFGSFKSKSAAQDKIDQLKDNGISAKIVNKDGAYKVIGQLFETKDKAKAALKKLDKTVNAFVTQI